ncbi:hypothetical protein D9756_004247 [Leucocoprinus leucothites]|uniref:Uncharacterized protein n=1 Tax=Leucocoprinus leucothites TaxID=201217 RepID=A0A8H5DB07_9AGAR|nr:hypothetical protein D9756_004247 [Leucoagaricus leucothites]
MPTQKLSDMSPRGSGQVSASDGLPGDTSMDSSLSRNGSIPFIPALLGLTLQVLVWVVKSNVQNSVATAFIGLFYGPVFPGALGMANDVLPEEVHMVSMALMYVQSPFLLRGISDLTEYTIVLSNAFASLGGAIFPVVAGTILNLKGVSAFTLVTVPLAASLAVLWGLFPSRTPVRSSPV